MIIIIIVNNHHVRLINNDSALLFRRLSQYASLKCIREIKFELS